MTKNSQDEWLQYQPVALGPAWRSILASQLAIGDLPQCVEDNAINAAASFLGHRESDPAAAAEAYPLLAAAYDVNTDYRLVDRLKIMVAGRLEPTEIAVLTGLNAEIIAAWETLFFAVRNSQTVTSWLVLHLVVPEQEAGNLELASNLKLAIFGGPEAARLILSGAPCRLDEQVDRIAQLRLKLQLKSEHAFDVPVETPEQSIRWVQLSTSFQLAEKRLALEEKKLAARCAADAGLPATTASGLDTLGRSELDEFCDVFRLVRSFNGAADQSGVGGGIPSGTGEAPSGIPAPPGASNEPVILSIAARQDQPAAGTSALPPVPGQVPVLGALVAWSLSLATLETPPQHAAVAAHLRQLSHYLGLSGQQITSWQPTPQALQQIKFARRIGSARELQNILSLSVRRDFLPGSRGGLKKCTTLAAALASCLAADGDPDQQKRSWQILQKQLERLVYTPLVQQAEESSDPVRISDFVALAETNRVLHDLLFQTHRKLQTGARRRTQDPPLSREELLYIDKLLKLSLLLSSKLEPAAVDTAS